MNLNEPSNVDLDLDQIWSNKKHIHIGNHATNNNLASNLFDFQ